VFFASQQVILSVIGVPGALLAGWTVELPYLGRRGSLAISTGMCLHLIDFILIVTGRCVS
jgi:sugar phosphate permease